MPCAIAAQTLQASLSCWSATCPCLISWKVLNRVYALHKHHEPVANIFGGSQARLIVADTKNRSIGARLIRARL
jgi:ABC-type uncharacterized transport system auxiliary subunit